MAEFGSIGVSPGDRVEGFSSPLQFLVAAVAFRIAPLGYQTFLEIFVAVTIGSIGTLVALAIYFASRGFGNARTRSAWMGIILSALVAVSTLSTWTAAGWMVSGMENPLVMVAGLAVVVFTLSGSSGGANTVGAIAALSMLGMARVEFAAFVVPVVAAVAMVQAQKAAPGERPLVFLLTLSTPLAALAASHVARRLYFGAWLPNTALVQGRAQGRDQMILLACLAGALAAALLHAMLARAEGRSKLLSAAKTTSALMVVPLTATAVWMTVAGRSKGSLGELLLLPSLVVLVATLTMLMRLVALVDRHLWMPNFVFWGLVFVPLGQFLVRARAVTIRA